MTCVCQKVLFGHSVVFVHTSLYDVFVLFSVTEDVQQPQNDSPTCVRMTSSPIGQNESY